MSKDKIEVSMNVYDIPILIEELEKADSEIKKLREENQQLKKQKDDVAEGLKDLRQFVYDELVDFNVRGATETYCKIKDLLRMLGEIDNE